LLSRTFFSSLSVLYWAGVPIDRCLHLLGEEGLAQEVRSGSSLSAAMKKRPDFSPFQLQLVRVGEKTGSLPLVLANLADHQERADELNRKVRATLTYPAVVLAASLAMVLLGPPFLMRGQFELLRSHGQEPPLISRLMLALSHPAWWLLALAAVVALARWLKTERSRLVLQRLPAVGPLLRCLALARFSEALSQLLRSGVLLSEALPLAASVSANRELEESIPRGLDALREGGSLSQSLEATGFFPRPYLAMIEVGENVGKLPDLTAWMASLYRLELQLGLDRFTALLEPAVLLVLGVLVGAMLLATLLPILSTLNTV
jgi:type II secretory pathway component PulF